MRRHATMASFINKGESIFIPFRNERSISDSQMKPRMYKSVEAFHKKFPRHYLSTDGVDLVEYAPVLHGRWIDRGEKTWCSECGASNKAYKPPFCPHCGVKMDGGESVASEKD